MIASGIGGVLLRFTIKRLRRLTELNRTGYTSSRTFSGSSPYNRLKERAEYTTADNNILRRRWLPIDLDPVRPAGISSSEQEHAAAVHRARTIADDMVKEWDRPIIADSGNGAHLLYRIDLPNNQESLAFVCGALPELDRRYSDTAVKVDVTSANAARIWKAYGTVARKGDSIPGLPHRLSRILEVPVDKQ
jgi:hypothetical protein